MLQTFILSPTTPPYPGEGIEGTDNHECKIDERMKLLAQAQVFQPYKKNNTLPLSREPYLVTSTKIDLQKFDQFLDICWKDLATKNLTQIYNEYSEENWDGYNAVPISQGAYYEAEKLLNMMIPSSFSMLEIAPEPDGGIGLEWYKDKGFSFVVSVNGKGVIHYAGLFGKNNEVHGTESFITAIPEVILHNLRRLFNETR